MPGALDDIRTNLPGLDPTNGLTAIETNATNQPGMISQTDTASPTSSIRDNVPALDTTITAPDVNDVTTATTTQAAVERVQPPEDIDAATIGDYTPYQDVQGSVDPNSMVETRLTGLLSQNSDYMQRARTEAEQMANRRGMLNTSMAVGSAQGAAIDRALPIAQQDASAHLQQQFLNQGYSNDAAKYLAEQSVQRENLQAGLEQDTNQFNQTNSLTNQRLNMEAQNLSNNEFANAQNLAAANAAAEENRNNFATLNADLNAQLANIDNQAAMNLEQLAREYAIIENLDSINGSIYQQLVAEIGTILASTPKANEATAKVNAMIQAAGVEFSFSSGGTTGGTEGGGGTGGGTTSATPLEESDVRPPRPSADHVWNEDKQKWEKRSSSNESYNSEHK